MKNKKKAIAILSLSIALALSLHAQTINTPPTIAWQKCIGGSAEDVANCVKVTPDGGYIIAGGSFSNNGDMSGNHGQKDFCLIKLNADGTIAWQHSYGGSGIDEAIAVVLTPDGGYAAAGKSASTNGDVTGNHGSADYWIIKTNALGVLQWQKSYGGSGTETANSIYLTTDNGFVICGVSYSFNGNVTGNHGGGDAWVIKLDQNGNLQWQKAFGGSLFDIANSLQQTTDGGYIVGGYTLSNDGDLTNHYGEEDYWIFKLDASGNLQWQRSMGGTGGDCISSIIQTMDGGYIMNGLSHTKNNFDVSGSHGGHEMWIVKTDAYGATQWAHCFGGSDGENGIDIRQQSDGSYVACSDTKSLDGQVVGNHGSYDFWLTGISSDGNLLWQKTLGGSMDDLPKSMQLLPNGQIIMAGKTTSNDGDVSGNHGDFDFWVIKLNPGCNSVFYKDADGDGYGDADSVKYACIQPAGYVSDNTDCNVGNSAIHPGANEICNGLDDNCNSIADEGLTFITYFIDADHDGFGSSSDPGVLMCSNPGIGYAAINTDCNDNNSSIHPGANEICNGLDDDCNGAADDGLTFITYFIDADHDGFGSSSDAGVITCSNPGVGYSTLNTDCNDGNPSIHPGILELCNGLDDDCNGVADDGLTFITYFIDADHDGFGSPTDAGVLMCSNPGIGYSSNNTDCDDGNAMVNPAAAEICNNLIDEDCSGQIDDNCTTYIYHADLDGDSFGDPNTTIISSSASPPAGFVLDNSDCNDSDPLAHAIQMFYIDADEDGFGSLSSITLCASLPPAGYSFNNTDCNDSNPQINPGAFEICYNLIDDNCNGQVDDNCTSFIYYADNDNDSYGNLNNAVILSGPASPPGFVLDHTDCNDNDPSVHTTQLFYIDADEDGFGSLATAILCSSTPPLGYSYNNTDCNDGSFSINPGANEVCNGLDDNCNGSADEGLTFIIYYTDADHDGFGSSSDAGTLLCSNPGINYSTMNTDCNDGQSAINPNAAEICNNLDDNCNDLIDDGVVNATITPSGNVVVCSGTITLNANTGTGFIYQWKKNSANISGATNSSYNTKVAALYTVKVSSGSCSATSGGTNVSVGSLPAATITPPGTISLCPGISLIMNANAASGLTYQWQKSAAIISGATNSGYATSVTGSYKVVVTNSTGCSKTSAVTTLNNYATASVKISVTGNLNICSTGSVTLSAKVVSGYTYKWFKDNVSIGGATGTSFIATQAGTYYYQATTSDGCSAISASKVVAGCRLENESDPTASLAVYPNPTNGNFIVELHLDEALNSIAKIELINMIGNIVLAEDASMNNGSLLHPISMKDELPDALYFVKIIVGDQIFFQRIIYQK